MTAITAAIPSVSFEVISADSRQVYRGFDIGTAKPSDEERRRILHHGIDICDPEERFDVGRFVALCDGAIPSIQRRGAVPIVSGGTAFYLQGYLFGLPDTPLASEEVRNRLIERCREEGLDALREELRRVDPISDERIATNDRYRVLRALEVYYTAGRPLSSFPHPTKIRPGIDPLIIGLSRNREELYRRINTRVEKMFNEGLPAEVARLASTTGFTAPAFEGIGYREFNEMGGDPPWDDVTLASIRERIARNTRRYAKRQELFFRRIPGVEWIPADDHAALVGRVRRWIETFGDNDNLRLDR